MKYFRLLFDHVAWIEHQFLSGIRDSREAGSLWPIMRGVGGVMKSVLLSRLAKGLGLGGYYVEVLREFRERFLGKRPALFKSVRWHFHQDNTPVLNSILVTDYLSKMGNNFEFQSRYYVHFRANTLEKDISSHNHTPRYELNWCPPRMNLALNNPRRLICH